MKVNLKKVLLGLLAVLLVLQFFRPERNESNAQGGHIATKYPVPEPVEAILKSACYDCHSNLTRYPWYTNIQPIGLWMAAHVRNGKRELNFSEFTARRAAVQNHKLEEIIEMVDEGAMPLKSYTWTHADARLDAPQKKLLTDWARGLMDTLRTRYPADSLVLRRK